MPSDPRRSSALWSGYSWPLPRSLSLLCLLIALFASACALSDQEVRCRLGDCDQDGVAACTTGGDPRYCDCDDGDKSVYPGAADSCDFKDNDCDGLSDEDAPPQPYYLDQDGDGWGDEKDTPVSRCESDPQRVANRLDCDDNEYRRNPSEEEVCDGLDNDCNGQKDDNAPPLTWWLDQDNDGYGGDAFSVQQCAMPEGYSLYTGDCEDHDPAIHPNAVESCSESAVDYNCDGQRGDEDHDKDTFAACRDCNDGNVAIYPGAIEVCNGQDDDCSALIDDVQPGNRYRDRDLDFFSADVQDIVYLEGCPVGWTDQAPSSQLNTDCDDTRADTYPGALELCDGIDNDCEGTLLDSESDQDGDQVPACAQISLPPDCDDLNPAQSPFNDEVCDGVDNDCDGQLPSRELDMDQDGFRACDECDDTNAHAYPGGYEACDGLDNNCDGHIDEGLTMLVYSDQDGDGFGAGDSPAQESCALGLNQSANNLDCNDADPMINPAVLELVGDGVDNNCNGSPDEANSCLFLDTDGDGFGAAEDCKMVSSDTSGYVTISGDCDDNDDSSHPGAPEICDAQDNDCDGTSDEGVETNWYIDHDGDGYGSLTSGKSQPACTRPEGYSGLSTDCDDENASIHPDQPETCGNDVDENCNGSTTEAGVPHSWYQDEDGDGYGAEEIVACVLPDGAVTQPGDCNDHAQTTHPEAVELCDGIDNNCDGAIDNQAVDAETWYFDGDGDGFGMSSSSLLACEPPSNCVAVSGDCNDLDPFTYPEAEELDDGLDNDCDGYNETDDPLFEDMDVWVSPSGEDTVDGVPGATSLQQAASLAPECGVVLVAEGSYSGSLSLKDKCITLKGVGGAENTILVVDPKVGSVIQLVGGNVTLEGFTIVGGSGTASKSGACFEGNSSEVAGGGICARGTTLTGSDLVLNGNFATYGGELYLKDSTTVLDHFVLTGSAGITEGGGLYQAGGSLTLSDGEISGYSVMSNGAGAYSLNGALFVERVSFHGNTASGYGGGIFVSNTGQALSLTSGAIYSNIASQKGGGAFLTVAGATHFADMLFKSNVSASGGGAYVTPNSGADLTATALNFHNNISSGFGAGLFLSLNSGSASRLNASNFDSNVTNGQGGGLYLSGSPANAVLEDLSFSANSSADGGGVFAILSGNVALRRLTLTDNVASSRGGALFLTGGGTVEDVTIRGASAQYGGGLFLQGSTRLNRVSVRRARASTNGGGLYCDSMQGASLLNLDVMASEAIQYGGGIFVGNIGNCQFRNITVARNWAWIAGGGVYLDIGSPVLANSIVAYNGAADAGSNLYYAGNSGSPTFILLDSLLFNPSVDGDNLYGISTFVLQNYRILQVEPGFIRDVRYGEVEDLDVHLRPDSPARNRGSSSSSDNDPDGSRNDMGAFGGPSSAATDADLDGLPDDWETQHGLDPAVKDADDDGDGDGLSNATEYAAGLVPTLADSDDDGVDDDTELAQGTHPLDPFDHIPGEVPVLAIPTDFSSLQSALDYAYPDTELRLAPGEYKGNSHAAFKPVVLEGTAGREQTLLRGDGTQSVILLHAMELGTELRGLTISGGKGSYDGNSRSGGGIFVQWSSLSMTELWVTANSASSGGGMYQNNGTSTLSHTVFEGNSASTHGGGMYQSSGTSTLSHTVFEGNSAGGYGGAIRNDGTITLKNSILTSNTAYYGSSYANWSSTCPATGSGYNLYYVSSTEDGTPCTLASTDRLADPLFLADGDYHLKAGSPAINAGDATEQDPDGSRADIGLYGGPGADDFDFDGDGYPDYYWPGGYANPPPGVTTALFDCDDGDPEAYPGHGC